jgi:hypothetical protein
MPTGSYNGCDAWGCKYLLALLGHTGKRLSTANEHLDRRLMARLPSSSGRSTRVRRGHGWDRFVAPVNHCRFGRCTSVADLEASCEKARAARGGGLSSFMHAC